MRLLPREGAFDVRGLHNASYASVLDGRGSQLRHDWTMTSAGRGRRRGHVRLSARSPVAGLGRPGLRRPAPQSRLTGLSASSKAVLTVLGWGGWSRLATLLTAVTAIAALWFTAQSLKTTQDQVGLIEQGHLTDRFAKAVEQLGSERLDVRLGGIYALERLARDSRRDHPVVVVEVLAAFVRTRSPLASCSPSTGLEVDIQAALKAPF